MHHKDDDVVALASLLLCKTSRVAVGWGWGFTQLDQLDDAAEL